MSSIPKIDGKRLRLGLISDTHVPESRSELWQQVYRSFRINSVDCILHGGDIYDIDVIDQLSDVAPTYAARGNGDNGSGGRRPQPEDKRLREFWVLKVGGLSVGVTHIIPLPETPPNVTLENFLLRNIGTSDLDVLVYGDTHVEAVDTIGKTLCVNPGSPTLPHNLRTQLGTVGLLDISDERASATIWQIVEDGIVPKPIQPP